KYLYHMSCLSMDNAGSRAIKGEAAAPTRTSFRVSGTMSNMGTSTKSEINRRKSDNSRKSTKNRGITVFRIREIKKKTNG
ncbi:hypothetical protein AVEN_212088-1, partial [Araneus ventricosus]